MQQKTAVCQMLTFRQFGLLLTKTRTQILVRRSVRNTNLNLHKEINAFAQTEVKLYFAKAIKDWVIIMLKSGYRRHQQDSLESKGEGFIGILLLEFQTLTPKKT
jgi:hypothetical protein